jgi:hypothetical protein
MFAVVLTWSSCTDSKVQVKETKNEKEPEDVGMADDGRGEAYETYMAEIDAADSLMLANTLYYAKPNGESYQLYLRLDEESNIVRTEAQYTREGSGSILRTFFYYKDGNKYATKEIYSEGDIENEQFFERVSYYNEAQEPVVSKIRSARFEEYLENEVFKIIDPVDCSDEKAMRALARKGEFETNFVGVIRQEGINYIIVGEGVEGGFTTSLVVQEFTPLISQLLNSPDSFKGKALDIEFQEVADGQGFTFQSLLGLKLAK